MDQRRFSDFPLRPELLRVLEELRFERPTTIQSLALPPLLAGKDVRGKARTGSGKTLAFSLPILNKINLDRSAPQALILCPTRELCTQVAAETRRLGRRLPSLKVLPLVGGEPFGPQARSLGMGAHILVGTPGRVADHLRRQTLDLSDTRFLVLDEADRMLDMGFFDEVRGITDLLPTSRQTALFSATYPDDVEQFSRDLQRTPLSVEAQEERPEIRQLRLTTDEKVGSLQTALFELRPETAIVFCHLKATTAELAASLEEAGYSAAALHGDLDQNDRNRVMAMFRNGSTRVLVATDVAARGIDVAGLDLVVNYDFPKPDIYIHRIGRTGRAGKKGLALSLLSPGEDYKLKSLQENQGLELEDWSPAATKTASASAEPESATMATLYVGGGRKDKVRPGDILGALTGEAGGLKGSDVGKIEIHDKFSYVAVKESVADQALESLRNGKIKGRRFRIEPVS